MKSISTLIQDIQQRLTSGEPFDEQTVTAFAHNLAKKLANRLSAEHTHNLRISNLGTKCDRKLWLSIKAPEVAEPLSAATRLKFLFGDVLEELILFLARAAGHTVEKEQDEVNLNGVFGHIDGVIDGCLVDVKSASSYGYLKFKEHKLQQDDPFGYLTQIAGYAHGLGQSNGSFLAVDKSQGHITLDTYELPKVDFNALVASKRQMLAGPMPKRGYRDEPEGASGNRKLGVACSYCAFKRHCWPNLRVFRYSRGPMFLTHVAKEPKVQEIKFEDLE